MDRTNALRDTLDDNTKDLKLNIQSVLAAEVLSPEQTWGCAICAAIFVKDWMLTDALIADANAVNLPDAILADARAAAGLMAMNTVYYRFRHMVADDGLKQVPPRLRMNRMRNPATDKITFELMSMSCAVLEGCEMCINAHAKSLGDLGASPQQIHESVRIAAAVRGFSTAAAIASHLG